MKGVWRTGHRGKQQEDKGKHKGREVDEEMSGPASTLSISSIVRDLLRAAEAVLLPQELGKMTLGKYRCLSNLFKFSRL